jgi:hypothetical protein
MAVVIYTAKESWNGGSQRYIQLKNQEMAVVIYTAKESRNGGS